MWQQLLLWVPVCCCCIPCPPQSTRALQQLSTAVGCIAPQVCCYHYDIKLLQPEDSEEATSPEDLHYKLYLVRAAQWASDAGNRATLLHVDTPLQHHWQDNPQLLFFKGFRVLKP